MHYCDSYYSNNEFAATIYVHYYIDIHDDQLQYILMTRYINECSFVSQVRWKTANVTDIARTH